MTRTGAHRLPCALAVLALPVLLAGCFSSSSDKAKASETTANAAEATVSAVPDTARPQFLDSAPGDRQLPAPVVRAMRGSLESWTLAWHAALPTLRLDQFARTGVAPFDGDAEGPFVGGVEGTDLRLLHLVVPSPDVMLVLDPWLDLELERDSDMIRVVHTEEPGVGLIDLRRRRERRLFDLPAGTRVDGARWIDDSRVIVLADEPVSGGGRRPAFHLVDVRAGTVEHYAGPVADAEAAREARASLDRYFLSTRPELALGR